MSNDEQKQADSATDTGATDGHQDVGGQNETIPAPQQEPSAIDVSDIEERPAPDGGDSDANA